MNFELYQIFFLVGVLDILFAFGLKWFCSRTDWPLVEGTVTAVDVLKKGTNYVPIVEYEYMVRGETFQGSRISVLNPTFSNEKSAQDFCRNYPVGETVHVYHHPQEPKKAVLNPNIPPMFYPMVVSGVVFIMIGFWWMLDL